MTMTSETMTKMTISYTYVIRELTVNQITVVFLQSFTVKIAIYFSAGLKEKA